MAKPRPHIPTAKTLSQVLMGAMLGTPPDDIAKLLGITRGQLLKHYAKELETGPVRADQAVRANLLNQAKSKGPGAVAAAKAWLDRRQTNGNPLRAEGLITPTEFARAIGVSKSAVLKAVRHGRVPIYDETGARLKPGEAGRFKFLRLEEATLAWRLNRSRFDPAKDDPTIIAARIAREKAQVELLQLRLAKERGELISRAAQLEACETAGRMVTRAIMASPMWTEEIVGIYRTGGDSALRQWLRAKAVETCNSLADLMTAPDDSL